MEVEECRFYDSREVFAVLELGNELRSQASAVHVTVFVQVDARLDFFYDAEVDLVKFDCFCIPILFVFNHFPALFALPAFEFERSVVKSCLCRRTEVLALLLVERLKFRHKYAEACETKEVISRSCQFNFKCLLIDSCDTNSVTLAFA